MPGVPTGIAGTVSPKFRAEPSEFALRHNQLA